MTYYRTVHFSDTDGAGVVYFASLLSICHEAYEDSLAIAGIDLKTFFHHPETAIPIVHAEIDFFCPLFCGDRLEIDLTSTQLKETAFEIAYDIQLASSPDQAVAKAKTKHVCINPVTRQRIALSEIIIQWLQTTENA